MNITFIKYQSKYENDLLKMMEEFYQIDDYSFDKNTHCQLLRDFSSQESLGIVYLILGQDAVIGYFVLAFGFSFEYGGRDAIIDELYIKENFRGQGLGSEILDFIKKQSINLGIKALHLEVEQHNERAIKLYQKNGFKSASRFLMTRKLTR